MNNVFKNNNLRKNSRISAGLGGLLLVLSQTAAAFGIEKPEYTVVHKEDGIEYRQYEPYLVSESIVTAENGDYVSAGQDGVDRLLAFIRGDNRRGDDADRSEKISMTLPIEQSMTDAGWRVSLKIPSRYSRADVPVPNDTRVTIREVPGRLMAVLRHSGRWTQENFTGHMEKLSAAIEAHEVQSVGQMEMALYNPPVTPPFLRRNEVMVEVSNLPESAADETAILRAAAD